MRPAATHTPGEGRLGAWDVGHLLALGVDLPARVPLDELPEIDSDYWFDEWEGPTVRKVVKHFRLVGEVDLSYPIIF